VKHDPPLHASTVVVSQRPATSRTVAVRQTTCPIVGLTGSQEKSLSWTAAQQTVTEKSPDRKPHWLVAVSVRV